MVNSFSITSNPKDVRYLNVDTRVRGYGPNRLKALEMEGRWVLSPDSIPFITEAFKQIEKLNGPGGMPELADCYKNATGQHNWGSESQLNREENYDVPINAEPGQEYMRRSVTIRKPPRSQSVQYVANNTNIGRRSESPLPLPPLPQIQTDLPHRTNGYGPAHQYKRASPTELQHLPRSQSVSPRSVSNNLYPQRIGNNEPKVQYTEFEHELLHTNWPEKLKHVDTKELERQKRSRSPSMSPLKVELLAFDRQKLKSPFYEKKLESKIKVEKMSALSEDSTNRLLIIADSNLNPKEANICVNLSSASQPLATASATIQQREIKHSRVGAEILIVDDDEESNASDDTTLRMQSTDDWADDDEDDRRLTERYRDVNELELGIQSLQREMGLLLGLNGVENKVDKVESVNTEKKTKVPLKHDVQQKPPNIVSSTDKNPANPVKVDKSAKSPVVAERTRKTSTTITEKKSEEMKRKASRMILRPKTDPLLERWVIEKQPKIYWTVKEQALEFKRHTTKMIKEDISEVVEVVERSEDIKNDEVVIKEDETNVIKEVEPKYIYDNLINEKTPHFCTKSKTTKKARQYETAFLPIKAIKATKKEVKIEEPKNDEKPQKFKGPVQDRSDSVETPTSVTIKSLSIPPAAKYRTKSTRRQLNVEEIEVIKEVKEPEEIEVVKEVVKEVQKPPSFIEPEIWLQVQKQFNTLPFEVQVQIAQTIQTNQQLERQEKIKQIERQKELQQQLQKQEKIKQIERQKELQQQQEKPKSVIKEVDRLLLTQAILADMENRVATEEDEPKNGIGGMMKRLLTQKKSKRKTKKDATPERKVSKTETPSLSSYGSFGQMSKSSEPERLKRQNTVINKSEESRHLAHNDGLEAINRAWQKDVKHESPQVSLKSQQKSVKLKEPTNEDINEDVINPNLLTQLLNLRQANLIDDQVLAQILKKDDKKKVAEESVPESIKRAPTQRSGPQMGIKAADFMQQSFLVAEQLKLPDRGSTSSRDSSTKSGAKFSYQESENKPQQQNIQSLRQLDEVKRSSTTHSIQTSFPRSASGQFEAQFHQSLPYIQNYPQTQQRRGTSIISPPYPQSPPRSNLTQYHQQLLRFPSVHAQLLQNGRRQSTQNSTNSSSSTRKVKKRGFSQKLRSRLSDAMFHMNGIPLAHKSLREPNRLLSRKDQKRRHQRWSESSALKEAQLEDESEYARVEVAADYYPYSDSTITDRPDETSRHQSMILLTPHHLQDASEETGPVAFNPRTIYTNSSIRRVLGPNSSACTKVPGQGPDDPGYYSSYSYTSSNQHSPHSPVKTNDYQSRVPHRTQALSDIHYNNTYDNEYDDSILRRANSVNSLRDRYDPNRRIRWALPASHKLRKRFTSNEGLFSPGTERQHFYEPIYDKDGLEHWTQYQGEFKKRLPGGRTSIDHFRWP